MDHEVPEMEMIIIKRGHAHEEHPHGGAWKVAFADFMTAMMAFFLVLWIVNSTNKETRSSVARYFNPIRISDTTAARKGLKDPREVDFDAAAASEDKPVTQSSMGKSGVQEGQVGAASGGKVQNDATQGAAGALDPITAQDPFIVLDALAARAAGASAANGRASSAEYELLPDAAAPFRDPFAPPAPVLPPEATPSPRIVVKPTVTPPNALARPQQSAVGAESLASDRAAADTQLVAERLRDQAEKAGVAKDAKDANEGKDKQDAKAGAARDALAEAANLREGIARVLREAGLAQGPKLEVRVVEDGILISLTDHFNFGMFAIGSAEPQPRVVQAMQRIGELLQAQPGSFVVRGHTDSRPYKSRAYDNWRLSAARAQIAAYMLMRGKLDERRIERIEGHADRAPRNVADPMASENRRIEILLRRPK